MPYRADRGALVKPADEMEQQPEVTHVATLFPAVVLVAVLTTLVPVAAAETGAAPKSIADDYIGRRRAAAGLAPRQRIRRFWRDGEPRRLRSGRRKAHG
jgi:hypothetical protein